MQLILAIKGTVAGHSFVDLVVAGKVLVPIAQHPLAPNPAVGKALNQHTVSGLVTRSIINGEIVAERISPRV